MNWFFHKVYWTKWIGKRNAQRKRVARAAAASSAAQVLGLVALGFSSVYREGFEVVLFLQSLQLQAGTATVLEGVAIGLAGTAAVGAATFFLQQKLPYKRMLVVTGVMLGVVLVVMVGGSRAHAAGRRLALATPARRALPRLVGALVRGRPDLGDARRAGARRDARDRLLLRGRVPEGAPPEGARRRAGRSRGRARQPVTSRSRFPEGSRTLASSAASTRAAASSRAAVSGKTIVAWRRLAEPAGAGPAPRLSHVFAPTWWW